MTSVMIKKPVSALRTFSTLDSCLWIPEDTGVDLHRLTVSGAKVEQSRLEPNSNGDYLRHLADRVNHDLIGQFVARTAGQAYILTFCQGDFIRDRIQLIRTSWKRLWHCLGLAEITGRLTEQNSESIVREAIYAIRKRVSAKLLGEGFDDPARLLVRIANPDTLLTEPYSYEAVRGLVEQVARLHERCDKPTLDMFRESELGSARELVARRLHTLLDRFDFKDAVPESMEKFDTWLQLLKGNGCLHPALPVQPIAVDETSSLLNIPESRAREVITLLRFAWLSRLEQTTDQLDFSVECIVIKPHREAWYHEPLLAATEGSLQSIFEVLQYAADSQKDLLELNKTCPDIRIGVSASVVTFPKRFYELFGLRGGDWLDLIVNYRLGEYYLRKQLGRREAERPRADDRSHMGNGQLTRSGENVGSGIVFLKTRIAESGYLTPEKVAPYDLTPERVMTLISDVIEAKDEEAVERCGELLSQIAQGELSGNIRGVWCLKGEGGVLA